MIFHSSPYFDNDTGEEVPEHGLLCYSPLDGEDFDDSDWIVDFVDLTEEQAEALVVWANEKFAGDNHETLDEAALFAKAEEMAAQNKVV